MDWTTFYYTGWGRNLVMESNDDASSSSEEETSSMEEEGNDWNDLRGFVGIRTDDIPYQNVLDNLDFRVDFEDLSPLPALEPKNLLEQAVVENRTPLFYARREQVPNLVKAEVILNWVYLNKSRREEAVRRDMTEQLVDIIIYEFQVLRRITKKTRKSENMRRLKVTKRHIEALREFAGNHFNCGFTLAEARNYLRQNILIWGIYLCPPFIEWCTRSWNSVLKSSEILILKRFLQKINRTSHLITWRRLPLDIRWWVFDKQEHDEHVRLGSKRDARQTFEKADGLQDEFRGWPQRNGSVRKYWNQNNIQPSKIYEVFKGVGSQSERETRSWSKKNRNCGR